MFIRTFIRFLTALLFLASFGSRLPFHANAADEVGPQIEWKINQDQMSETLTGVAYGNGVYVAIGGGGYVRVSDNSIDWKAYPTGIPNEFTQILFDGTKFIAVNNRNDMGISGDGKSWTRVAPGSKSPRILATNGTTLVGISTEYKGGYTSYFFVSKDKEQWVQSDLSISGEIISMVWDGSYYLALERMGVLYESLDGITWKERSRLSSQSYSKLLWLNRQYIVLTNKNMYVSTDGSTWKEYFARNITDMIWDGSRYIATSSGLTGNILVSAELTKLASVYYNKEDLYALVQTPTGYVAVGDKSILTSKDALQWEPRLDSERLLPYLISSVWDGQKYLIRGAEDYYVTTDGVHVTKVESVPDLSFYNWDQRRFYGAGPQITGTSTDGIHWTTESSQGVISKQQSVNQKSVYNGEVYVALNANSILYSKDGVNWVQPPTSKFDSMQDLIWNGEKFLVLGFHSIYTSDDGINWTTYTSKEKSRILNAAACSPIRCVVLGEEGLLITSEDLVHWTEDIRWTTYSDVIRDVVWSGRYFLAAAAGGKLITSQEGLVWSHLTQINQEALEDIQWNGAQFLITGSSGTIAVGKPEDMLIVFVNQKPVVFEQEPVLDQGVTLVPLRSIFNQLQASVQWNGDTQTVFAKRGPIEVLLTLGSSMALINGEEQILDRPMQLMNGVAMVPLRFVSETFGASVEWEESAKTISITTE